VEPSQFQTSREDAFARTKRLSDAKGRIIELFVILGIEELYKSENVVPLKAHDWILFDAPPLAAANREFALSQYTDLTWLVGVGLVITEPNPVLEKLYTRRKGEFTCPTNSIVPSAFQHIALPDDSRAGSVEGSEFVRAAPQPSLLNVYART
jgi:hypothetical protein